MSDRRTENREPTQQKLVTITLNADADDCRSIVACLKDLSGHGVGFVHQEELPMGPAVITFTLDDEPIDIEFDIRWSKKISKQWYMSGGFFLSSRQSQLTIERIRDQHVFANFEEAGLQVS
jgi:hypothetical protein